MANSDLRKIKDFFDTHAKGWDIKTYTDEHRKRIPDIIAGLNIKPGDTVLDVGSGAGILLPYLRKALRETGSIIELDISGNMLQEAQTIHSRSGTRYIQADVENLPLGMNAIDCIVCFSVFPHFNHPSHALRELRRVLRNRGSLYILHLQGAESLNACHRAIGGTVERHELPRYHLMRDLLNATGWYAEEIRDTENEYYVRAVSR